MRQVGFNPGSILPVMIPQHLPRGTKSSLAVFSFTLPITKWGQDPQEATPLKHLELSAHCYLYT